MGQKLTRPKTQQYSIVDLSKEYFNEQEVFVCTKTWAKSRELFEQLKPLFSNFMKFVKDAFAADNQADVQLKQSLGNFHFSLPSKSKQTLKKKFMEILFEILPYDLVLLCGEYYEEDELVTLSIDVSRYSVLLDEHRGNSMDLTFRIPSLELWSFHNFKPNKPTFELDVYVEFDETSQIIGYIPVFHNTADCVYYKMSDFLCLDKSFLIKNNYLSQDKPKDFSGPCYKNPKYGVGCSCYYYYGNCFNSLHEIRKLPVDKAYYTMILVKILRCVDLLFCNIAANELI